MGRDAAIGQATQRGFCQVLPLGVGLQTERGIHLPKKSFELGHRVKGWRLTGIGFDAFNRCA